jgi:hypothetical protein
VNGAFPRPARLEGRRATRRRFEHSCATVLLTAAVLCACKPPTPVHTVEVVGTDYAFSAPDTLPPVEVAFAFRNAGAVRHEVKVIALRPGIDPQVVLPLAMIDSGWAQFRAPTSGILTAGPGQATPGRLLVNLQSGQTYLLVCAFADSETAPLHSEMGMIRVLTVR